MKTNKATIVCFSNPIFYLAFSVTDFKISDLLPAVLFRSVLGELWSEDLIHSCEKVGINTARFFSLALKKT